MPRVSFCPICGKKKDWRAKICGQCKWWGEQPTEKTCNGCGKTYPIEEYALRPSGRTGHVKRRSRCRDCENEYSRTHNKKNRVAVKERARQYGKENPDKVRRWALRSSWKKRGYDPDEIEDFWKSHHGLCDICGLPPSGGYTNLAIDHDHTTGKIRGMLCNSCNLGLGKFKDDFELLQKAIDYLKK